MQFQLLSHLHCCSLDLTQEMPVYHQVSPVILTSPSGEGGRGVCLRTECHKIVDIKEKWKLPVSADD